VAGRAETREAVLAAGYACIAHKGMAKTSIGDVAAEAGIGRATVYRYFPGGRDELLAEVVGWEHRRFFQSIYVAIEDAVGLAEILERGLLEAHRAISEHEVLQLILATEPAAVSSVILGDLVPIRQQVARFLEPYLERDELAPGVDVSEASTFLARMVLSYMGSPGRWDLTDLAEVSRLVRTELLSGIAPRAAIGTGALEVGIGR
jgi:AcrR family transcriptional regulator